MLVMILFLLLIAVIFGIGFVVKWLFYLAVALALIWLIGFFLRGASHRWYRW